MTINSRIAVIGSVNMDISVHSSHIPVPGETILGDELVESPGGKGANQAVAAARLGGAVAMVGCFGADTYGERLRAALVKAGVDVATLIQRGPA